MTGLKVLRLFVNKWKEKPKPIATCKRDFSRALSKLQGIATNLDWFIVLFAPVVISRSGVCFTILNWKWKFKEKFACESKTWIDSSNLKTWVLYCLFGSVILLRRTSSGIFRYMNIGLGNIRFILKPQSTSPKYHYIGERKSFSKLLKRFPRNSKITAV